MAITTDISKHIKNSFLQIHVKPNSAETAVLCYDEEKGVLKVSVAAPAEDNKANIAVIKFFKKMLGKEVSIAKGLKSKNKILKIL